MTTGYTQELHDGKPVTFERFVLTCARAMGAAIMQRDEPLSPGVRERTVEPWYAERVITAARNLDKLHSLAPEEWEVRRDKEHADRTASNEAMNQRSAEIRDRYEAMLSQVREWEPPTSDHEGLRKFMIDQLEGSIRFDTSYTAAPPVLLSVADYKAQQLDLAQRELDRAKRSLAEEEARVASQNQWVRDLYASLGITSETEGAKG